MSKSQQVLTTAAALMNVALGISHLGTVSSALYFFSASLLFAVVALSAKSRKIRKSHKSVSQRIAAFLAHLSVYQMAFIISTVYATGWWLV
jgi:hypothetical protein